MFRVLFRVALIFVCLSPLTAGAQEIKLKLAFYSSERTMRFKSVVEPFVEAVNADGEGIVHIDVFPAGSLGKGLTEQSQYVADGVADLAYIIPGYKSEKFPDNGVISLPGLFRDPREASLVFTRMVAAHALRGYEDFIVITAVTGEPVSLSTRQPVSSLADLKGFKIRASSPIAAATLEKLGMRSVILPINQMVDDITAGTVDGVAAPPLMLTDFGIGRVTRYHYMLDGGLTPLMLVMSRAKFDSLPQQAQDIIRRYSGEWMASRASALLEGFSDKVVASLASDPVRKVIYPSPADNAVIQEAFKSVIEEWIAKDPRNGGLLAIAQTEIAKIRMGQ
jgi:TRAP-type C4-dicarboxylate transport system substrate-binding protein